jgi:ATP-dependent Clp protease adaptor protein ClpS
MFENWPFRRYTFLMAEIPVPQVLPEEEQATQTRADETLAPGYVVICWDDPVNLMDYVTHVFMTIFGWQRPKAEQHMLQVHRQGKSVLIRDGLERAEHYVHCLQSYGLTATLERAE